MTSRILVGSNVLRHWVNDYRCRRKMAGEKVNDVFKVISVEVKKTREHAEFLRRVRYLNSIKA